MAAKKDVKRFILISSYSIYDYTNIPTKSSVDEQSPLITDSKKYGPYPWAKLQQEGTVRRVCRDTELAFTILRLGAVYGPGATWTHRLGIMKGRTWFRFGSTAKIPLVYVGNTADAIALSVDAPNATNLILNVVDDNCPTQHQYMAQLKIFWNPKPIIVPLPFWALRMAAVTIWALARCFGRQYHVPLTLRPMCLDAMAKPMVYPNDRIKHVLGWQPCVTLTEALQRIFGKIE
jgi:nucleoside-diphosphate-sugar epimerase